MSQQLQPSTPMQPAFFKARLQKSEARAQELQTLVYSGTRHPDITIELQRLKALIACDLEVLERYSRTHN
jgi:hypothetical protein